MPRDYQWYNSVTSRGGKGAPRRKHARKSGHEPMRGYMGLFGGPLPPAGPGGPPPPHSRPPGIFPLGVPIVGRRSDSSSSFSGDSDGSASTSSEEILSRSGYGTDWSDDEGSDDSTYEIFDDFHTGMLSTQQSETESVDEVEKGENQHRSQVLQATADREVLNVVSSRYSSDNLHSEEMVWADDPALVAAEITHTLGPVSLTGNAKPQFRWIHYHGRSMSINQFFGDTIKLPGLTEEDCKEIGLIRQRIHKQAIRSFSGRDGEKGSTVEPVVVVRRRKLSKDTGREAVYLFLNMPFFSLERSQQSPTGKQASDYYFKSLLESMYPSISRARELQQVVCQLPGTPSGACFHISSLWSLVVHDKFLITFSKSLSTKDLCGESIYLQNELTKTPGTSQHILQICYRDEFYAVPLEHCNTWFKFTSMFHWRTHHFDDVFQVFWKGREVQPGKWDSVLKYAPSQSHTVFVKRRETTINRQEPSRSRTMIPNQPLAGEDAPTLLPARPSSPGTISQTDAQRDTLKPPKEGDPKNGGLGAPRSPSPGRKMSRETYLKDFYALRWMAIQQNKDHQQELQPYEAQEREDKARPHITVPDKTLESYNEMVEAYLGSIYTSMDRQPEPRKREAFRSCQPKSFIEACQSAAYMTQYEGGEVDTIRVKQEFFYAAELAFQAFLPLEQQGTICLTFWGGVNKIMVTNVDDRSTGIRSHLDYSLDAFISTAKKATQVRHQLSHGKGPDPFETKLPARFIKAWYHLLTYLLGVAGGPKTFPQDSTKHINRLESALEKAYKVVLGEDLGERISRFQEVRPSGTTALLISRIMEDMTGDNRKVKDTYWEYFMELQIQVTKDPYDRSHQTKLSSLLEEVKAVQRNLWVQRSILKKIMRTPMYGSDSHPRPPRHRALQDANRLLKEKYSLFALLEKSIFRAVEHCNQQIAINKDRQEQAIYVFTIVTIIFLPLSTVSSIFGMNTTDIRDIEHSQWLFWATAIPVTIIVVLISLLGAGILSLHSLGLGPSRTSNRSSSPSPFSKLARSFSS